MGIGYQWTPDDEIAATLATITDRHERAWHAIAIARLDDLHNDAIDDRTRWINDLLAWIGDPHGDGYSAP